MKKSTNKKLARGGGGIGGVCIGAAAGAGLAAVTPLAVGSVVIAAGAGIYGLYRCAKWLIKK